MLYVESSGVIRLTRGDTARLTVSVQNDSSGEAYTLEDGDTLTLTVKKSTKEATALIQKTLTGETSFYLTPEDTNGLSYGSYKYDVQLTLANGEVYTIIEPTGFEILQEVTW